MKFLIHFVLIISLVGIMIPNVFAQDVIPSWIKNNAGWWATDKIDDSSFLQGIQYLIKEGIMVIPSTETTKSAGSQEVPSWIKNNAGWWADGQIDDSSFVLGIQWLVSNGIIIVEEKQVQPVAEFRVAFIGDQGHLPSSFAVLELRKDEGAQMVLHQGDLDYENDPDKWDRMITNVLGDDFPYFVSVGQHDVEAWDEGSIWDGYQDKLYDRLKKNPEIMCVGDLGVKSACTYKGLFFILVSPGAKGSGHDSFIENQLNNNGSVWSVCSWAKNMNEIQLGSKADQTGWEVYNACKNGGAIIATGHEHSYHRTKTLVDIENQIVDPQWPKPDNLRVKEGSTFVFVSGLGGHSIRDQDRCLPTSYPYGCNHEWASIYTSDQDANFGALFCVFNAGGQSNKAYCYFKNIDGEIVDEFSVTSFVDVDTTKTSPAKTELPERDSVVVDLSKINLRGADLSGVDLVGIDLFGKDLTYANLSGQDLSDHDLTNTILRGADLSNSVLPDSGLSEKDFDYAILDGVDLSGKDLRYATFRYGSLDNTNLENANLHVADFLLVDLTKIKNKSLVNTNLIGAYFAHSNLSGVNLAGAALEQNNFHHANLSDVDFTDINNKFLRGSVFTFANLSNANFEGVDFEDPTIYSKRYPGKAHLINEMELGYYNQLLFDSGFPNKVIVDKDVSGNDLVQYYIFSNNFAHTNLSNVNFSNTDLRFSTFYDGNLTDANFSNAELGGSTFEKADLNGAVLEGAILNTVDLNCKNHPVCNN